MAFGVADDELPSSAVSSILCNNSNGSSFLINCNVVILPSALSINAVFLGFALDLCVELVPPAATEVFVRLRGLVDDAFGTCADCMIWLEPLVNLLAVFAAILAMSTI